MWASSGLARFELAHVFGHKSDERALEKNVFSGLSSKVESTNEVSTYESKFIFSLLGEA